MSSNRFKKPISLKGNILEIFNCDDSVCAKILFRPDCLKINIDQLTDLHLGDEVLIEGTLKINNIKSCFGQIENDPD